MPMSRAGARATHLSTDELALLRALLLCEVAERADRADESLATVEELTGQGDADSLLEREMAQVSAAYFDSAANDATDALRRLARGTYGTCERCAAPIPFGRLEAIPHARRCVDCA